ncbi:hypothetical protein MGH68_16070 [Erysipelothrix sp. D19-032]
MKKLGFVVLGAVAGVAIYETLRQAGYLDEITGLRETNRGEYLDDPMMQVDGWVDTGKGNIKNAVHKADDTISNFVEDVKDKAQTVQETVEDALSNNLGTYLNKKSVNCAIVAINTFFLKTYVSKMQDNLEYLKTLENLKNCTNGFLRIL